MIENRNRSANIGHPSLGSKPSPTLSQEAERLSLGMDSHESDLYLRATPEALELLERFPLHKKNAQAFTCEIHGGKWLDIPFAFDPFWQTTNKS
jgi:hypothetical protein